MGAFLYSTQIKEGNNSIIDIYNKKRNKTTQPNKEITTQLL